ncbi:MAG: bifunctional UDP-N-acetylglucosamine diphosphorylase/glucosamine-1-phosphate N-acetyltransferase GlmU [Gammaproteobacteria bacterium]|nr:bifunctional UDP-N-acetylglucosamine diphosphorylase/glucosamine-1-phosphate N-acetyltransferase GlmU [Gammaproteobacteria bacterium]
MALSIIILAGGSGTRMSSNLPKVLHKLAGKTLLDHVIDSAEALPDVTEVFVVYGHLGEMVLASMQHRQDVTWVEQKERLGTGHAVQQVLLLLNPANQVLILYGDVPLISSNTLANFIAATGKTQLGLLTAELPDPFGLGRILRDDHQQVLGIIEEKDASALEKQIKEINTGIYCVPAEFLLKWLPNLTNINAQKEYYLTDIVKMARDDKVSINVSKPKQIEEIYGANTRIELAKLERIYQFWQAQELMLQGVTLYDPARVDIRGTVVPARDCIIDVNVIFEGHVVLSENCIIGPNVVLKNVRLGKGVEIRANSVLEDCTVEQNAIVGPFARIRPGTILKEGCHIGNFVEVKKSTIGKGSKANHLSYIGDSIVGERVNIGAGVITCNYDGINKHQTIIEDDVFVGSDVQLIAPVTIAKGATIGAGSTITRDAPEAKLTLSRAKQMTVEGWVRPIKKKD